MREMCLFVAATHREGDRIFAAARNCDADVCIGDVLTPEGTCDPSMAVRVVSILVYGNYVNVFDPGMTGELAFEGAGIGAISPDGNLVGVSRELCPPFKLLGTGEMRIPPPKA